MPHLLDEIQRLKPKPKGCALGQWYVAASADDRADLEAALADSTIPATIIAQAMANLVPVKWSIDYVRKHRRRACNYCPRTVEWLNG